MRGRFTFSNPVLPLYSQEYEKASHGAEDEKASQELILDKLMGPFTTILSLLMEKQIAQIPFLTDLFGPQFDLVVTCLLMSTQPLFLLPQDRFLFQNIPEPFLLAPTSWNQNSLNLFHYPFTNKKSS